MRNGTVAIGLMSLVIVGLLLIHYYRNDGPVVLTYQEFQKTW